MWLGKAAMIWNEQQANGLFDVRVGTIRPVWMPSAAG
jgi:hypothetical protein